jgi:hypothetical protein
MELLISSILISGLRWRNSGDQDRNREGILAVKFLALRVLLISTLLKPLLTPR